MELRDFTYLITLAEEGSISKAADRLYMAQSSLSQFLAQTEAELGAQLFTRTSRGIRLTGSGKVFIGRLRNIMAEYQNAKNELWDSEHLKGGHVSFGISSFRGERILPLVLKKFKALYPDVQVDVTEANSYRLETLLLNGRLDIAVIAMPAVRLSGDVHFLAKDEIMIAAPCGHPLREKAHEREDGNGKWVSLEDAAAYDFVLSFHDTILGTMARELFRSNKIMAHAVHDNITAEMALAMAKEGIGLAFTYRSHIGPEHVVDLYSVTEQGVYLDLGVAFPPGMYHSKGSMAMEEVLREVYAENMTGPSI